MMLPFGLRSALITLTSLPDALEWNIRQQGVKILLHYLDDFITIGPPDTAECGTNMQKSCELCANLGIPTVTEKTVGPTSHDNSITQYACVKFIIKH